MSKSLMTQTFDSLRGICKVLNGLAPRYLGPLTRVADLPGRRAVRSAGSNRLHIPPVRLSMVAGHLSLLCCRTSHLE